MVVHQPETHETPYKIKIVTGVNLYNYQSMLSIPRIDQWKAHLHSLCTSLINIPNLIHQVREIYHYNFVLFLNHFEQNFSYQN